MYMICVFIIDFPCVHFQYIFFAAVLSLFFRIFARFHQGYGVIPAGSRTKSRSYRPPSWSQGSATGPGQKWIDNSTNFLCLARVLNLEILTIYHIYHISIYDYICILLII
jgi:hypothetical protein